MQFKRIYSLAGLKKGDKIALCSASDGIENSIGSNMNLTTGMVVEINQTAAAVKTEGKREIILTDFLIRMQSVYLIINKDLNRPSLSLVNLERKLRKSEKLNKRYEAILAQKFNISKEDLNNNLKKATNKPKKRKNYYTYKSLDMELPYLLDGKLITMSAVCDFKRAFDDDNEIKCYISAYYDGRRVAIGEGKAKCHPDDNFNREVGELISSTKALNDIAQQIY